MNTYRVRCKGDDRFINVSLDVAPTCCGPSLEEQIAYELATHFPDGDTLEPEIEFFRELPIRRSFDVQTIRVVRNYRVYGGPEEGGWYYDSEELVREFTVSKSVYYRLLALLQRYADRCNRGRHRLDLDGKVYVRPGAWKPTGKRHYC